VEHSVHGTCSSETTYAMLGQDRNDFVDVANVMDAHFANLWSLKANATLSNMTFDRRRCYVFGMGENFQQSKKDQTIA
jgi:hypothetical protein